MTEPDKTAGVPFEEEDLVVALQHHRLVQERLQTAFQVGAKLIDSDTRLGLALLKLDNLHERVPQLRTGNDFEIERLENLSATRSPFTDLDVLLLALRRLLADDFGGWVPPMGKNRHVGSVVRLGGRHDPMTVAGLAGGQHNPMFGAVSPFAGGRHDPMAAGNPGLVDSQSVPLAPAGGEGSGVRVGVLDTPLYPHRRLVGHVPESELMGALIDLRSHGTEWAPWEGHGIFVADLVLQQAPAAMLDTRAVLRGERGNATAWETAKKMVSFVDAGIDVLNLSLGCFTADGEPPLLMSRAVEQLSPSVLIVAAAGNYRIRQIKAGPSWPAALPDVVAVGATAAEGHHFSPEQPWVTCTAPGVDVLGAYLSETVTLPPRPLTEVEDTVAAADVLLGPGVGDPTTVKFTGYARWSGTSFAAATVSGAVAAAMTGGKTAREALDELLERSNGVVRKYVHQS